MRKDVREFLDQVYEHAVMEEGRNLGRAANKVRENLRAVLSWACEQDLIETLPSDRHSQLTIAPVLPIVKTLSFVHERLQYSGSL